MQNAAEKADLNAKPASDSKKDRDHLGVEITKERARQHAELDNPNSQEWIELRSGFFG